MLSLPRSSDDALAAIARATDALFKHTTKAVYIQDSTTRTTVMGTGTGSDALPAKEEVSALVQSMPGVADEDYDDVADAKEARNKIVKSVGGFVKSAVKKSAAKIADALTDSALAPLEKLHGNNLKSIDAIKRAMIALQAGIDDMAGAMTGATRKACIIRFDNQIKEVIGEYEKMNKLNVIIKDLDAQTAACTNVDNAENIEYEELSTIQAKRKNIDTEISRAAAAIVAVLNTQAATTKEERFARLKPMSIPTPLEGKGADLQDMILAYVLGKGTAMTTLIPAVSRMINDYDPDSGLWWSWSDLSDKDDDYLSVPECFRPLMKDQNRQLYADIKAAMAKSTAHKAMWSHINAVHSLGREPKQYNVTEGDGLGLFWMMTMLYRPSDEAYRENLEQETYALCRKLSLQSKGNPTKFIKDLRQILLDANALGVKLKWILTGKMVVTNMASRNNILAQKLQGYLDGTTAYERDDCAADIAHICALVEEGLAALEATGGDANRAYNTTSGSHGNGQEDCKFGNDCFAKACKWRHSKDHDPDAAWGREQEKRRTNEKGGKGGKSGKGGNSSKRGKGDTGKQRCKQQGCQEHQKQEYCNAHYRKLQERKLRQTQPQRKARCKSRLKVREQASSQSQQSRQATGTAEAGQRAGQAIRTQTQSGSGCHHRQR